MSEREYGQRTFYEIYPLTFNDANGDGIGDLEGIIEKLPYIKSLGFTGLWINPIFESAWKDGGYDIIDYFKVDKRFGTMDDALRLIGEAHRLGFLVFFDLVPGHTSWSSPMFEKSALPTPNEYSDLYIWTDGEGKPYPKAEVNLVHGLYQRDGAYWVNFFDHQPALNYGFSRIDYPSWEKGIDSLAAEGTRKFLESVMEFWLGRGVDGFRVDMADSLVKNDDDKTATIETWHRILREVHKEFPSFRMVSEWSYPERSFKAGFDSDFVLDHTDNFSHAFFRAGDGYMDPRPYEKPLLAQFDQKLWDQYLKEMEGEMDASIKAPGHYLSLISGNHDTWRIADSLKGNSLLLAYLMIFTLPNVPFVFAGDEAGQTTWRGLPSKEGGFQRTGARLPMKWDDSNGAFGFSKAQPAKLYLPQNPEDETVAQREAEPLSVLNLIKALNKLRDDVPQLTRTADFSFMKWPLSYRHKDVLVAMNLKDEPVRIPVGSGEILLAVGEHQISQGSIVLPKHSGVVFRGDIK